MTAIEERFEPPRMPMTDADWLALRDRLTLFTDYGDRISREDVRAVVAELDLMRELDEHHVHALTRTLDRLGAAQLALFDAQGRTTR